MPWIKVPNLWREVFEGSCIYVVDRPGVQIVSSKRLQASGQIVAREFVVRGGSAECHGRVTALMLGGSLEAHEGATVQANAGKVEAIGAEVEALFGSSITARKNSVVYVQGDSVVVSAHDESIIIMDRGCKARVELHDRAQIVHWKRRALAHESLAA